MGDMVGVGRNRFLGVLVAIFMSSTALGDDGLSGDWGGARRSLEEKGVEIEAIATADLVSIVSGGLDEGTRHLEAYDLTFGLDTDKAGLWKGGQFFAYFLGSSGHTANRSVGSVQGVDGIEAYDTVRLLELWYDHSLELGIGTLSLLAGLHDYSSEFDTLEFSSNLIHPSFAIGIDKTQSVSSVYPTTSLGLRGKLTTGHFYLQGVAYDGVAGDPEQPRGTHIRFDDGDGILWGMETGRTSLEGEPYSKVGFGAWLRTTESVGFEDEAYDSTAGAYVLGETMLFPKDGVENGGLGAFFRAGFAEEAHSLVGSFYSAGLRYSGLLRSRPDDAVSLGIASARATRGYARSTGVSDRLETALEVNYRAAFTSYLALTPFLEYISNPLDDAEAKDATIIGSRLEVAF